MRTWSGVVAAAARRAAAASAPAVGASQWGRRSAVPVAPRHRPAPAHPVAPRAPLQARRLPPALPGGSRRTAATVAAAPAASHVGKPAPPAMLHDAEDDDEPGGGGDSVVQSIQSPFPAQHLLSTLQIGSLDGVQLRAAFDRYDSDNNGVLCVDEIRALVSEVASDSITPRELHRLTQRFMREFDANKDGLVQRTEFEEGIKRLAKELDPRAHYLAACIMVAFTGFSVTFPLAPDIIRMFELTMLEFGSFTTIFTFSRMLGNVPSSVIADTAGRRVVLCAGLSLVGLGVAGTAWANNYAELALLRVATGSGVAATFTAAGMYLSDISHSLNSARTRAPMMMATAAGTMLGPPIGGILLEAVGLRHTCGIVGGAIFMTAAAALVLLPETLQPSTGDRRMGLREGFRRTLSGWAPLLREREMRRLLALSYMWNLCFWGVQALFPLFFVELDMSSVTVGYIFMMNAAVNFVCAPAVAATADRFGKGYVAVPGAVIYAGGTALIPYATSLEALVGLMCVLQLGGSMAGVIMSWTIDSAPRRSRSQMQGLYNTVGDAGGMVGSTAGACVAEGISLGAAFHFEGVLLLIATAVYGFVCFFF
eukprot:TRINITY_DN61294_c0_g1_i1.p1 TRINITY_DN61294_c0_g1~~TRINITY_DN61294_c0_g1_i1.p1  ORF type:complete len:595 (+),score=166.60 TRINITY_DN61294_c0_g1_i1:69-1853(+)